MINNIDLLEKKLNISFENKDLLIQSFTHRSYLNENPEFKLQHNERLEFLGDAILEHVVTEYLFKKYPDKTEGELTAWRASLVNTKILSEIAKELNFGDFLLLSHGEKKENNKSRQYILANTMEAFIGALYLDQGIEVCFDFIKKNIIKRLPEIIEQGLFKTAKSYFQEIAQERVRITPIYNVLEEIGPDHEKSFSVGVYLGEKMIAKGTGGSKQEAEEEAAKQALEIKGWRTFNNIDLKNK